jgi:hypothetical protein
MVPYLVCELVQQCLQTISRKVGGQADWRCERPVIVLCNKVDDNIWSAFLC